MTKIKAVGSLTLGPRHAFPQEGKELLQKASTHLRAPETRDYTLQAVQSQKQVYAVVEKCFKLVNSKDWEKLFGQKKRLKDPAVPSIKVVNMKGQEEEMWMFADEENPHKRLRLCTSFGLAHDTHEMTPSTHLHQFPRREAFHSGMQSQHAGA